MFLFFVSTNKFGDSTYYSSAKIKLIASAVAEKNMFSDLHLYEHLKLGKL